MKSKVQLKVLWLLLFLWSAQLQAQTNNEKEKYKQAYDRQTEEILFQQYQDVKSWFEDAYREYPTVPRGCLEAIAFQYGRFAQNVVYDTMETNPTVMPKTYSVMGLTLHGKGVFRESARMLASRTPYSLDAILWQPGAAVKAYACVFAQLQQLYGCYGDSVEQYRRIFVDLCELPLPEPDADDFAMNSFLYMIYWFLDQDEHDRYGVPHREVDFDRLFGQEYARLKTGRVVVASDGGPRAESRGADYPDATFVPAASCNYSSGRNGATISSVAIHYTQGTYSGAIAWFQNCNASASAHYVIRSIDGQVTQMVREADKAWHVGNSNGYTIGIEHEAYGNISSYFTTAMYQSSANLVKNICQRRPNINPHRVFYRDTLDDGTVLNYGLHSLGGSTACTQIRGHQHYPSQTHTDPGPYWNWNLYYKLINDAPSMTVTTAESGIFMDSGGQNGDYGDDERILFLIHVAGADSIALNFSQFDLEADYDFMWVYNGGSEFSPLIGRWNTESPGRVVATGDKMLVEFRSDCATVGAGWRASWEACWTDPDHDADDNHDGDDNGDDEGDDEDEEEQVVDHANPQTQINHDAAQWITGDFEVSFMDTDDSGIKWRFYQIMESDGTKWAADWTKGFLCDNFDYNLNASVWVNNTDVPWVVQGQELRQNDLNAEYAGIAAHHNGASHTAFLYDFYLKFNGGDQCSFFFNCSAAPSQTSLFSGYEVCFDKTNHSVMVYRLILGAKRLLKSNDQVYFSTGTSYFCRVVFDSSTGEIVVMRHANKLLRTIDRTLATTSNAYICFVTHRASVSVDNLRIYGSRSETLAVSVGQADTCGIRGQAFNGLSRAKLKSVVVDRAYKFSTLMEKALKVDYTAPSAISNLKLQTVCETQLDGTQTVYASASWNPSSDSQSGIHKYYYSTVDCYFYSWNNAWIDNGLHNTCNLLHEYSTNQPISISVVVENNAGLRSAPCTKVLKPLVPLMVAKSKKIIHYEVSSDHLRMKLIHDDAHSKTGEMGYRYILYDMLGRKLQEGGLEENQYVDVPLFSAGLYLCQLFLGPTMLSTEKIIVPN